MSRITLYNPLTDYDSITHVSRPPLGLIAIADACARHDITAITVIDDDIGRSDENWIERIVATDPDVVGITTWLGGFPDLNALRRALSQKTMLVAGGPLVSVTPEYHLASGADVAVVGNGTTIFPQLVKEHANGRPAKGKVLSPPTIGIIRFEQGYQFFPMEEYVSHWGSKRGFIVMTSFGCPFACQFCARDYLSEWQPRNSAHVAEEVAALVAQYGVDDLFIGDATFTGKQDHFQKMAGLLQRAGVAYFCMTRADCLDRERVKCLAGSGCRMVMLGLESASSSIAESLRGGKNGEKVLRAKALLEKAKIEVNVFVLFGLPGETETSLTETLTFVKKHKLKVSPNVLFPIPGTPIWDIATKKGVLPALGTYLERLNEYNRQNREYVSVPGICEASEEAIKSAVREIWRHNAALEK